MLVLFTRSAQLNGFILRTKKKIIYHHLYSFVPFFFKDSNFKLPYTLNIGLSSFPGENIMAIYIIMLCVYACVSHDIFFFGTNSASLMFHCLDP